jgi:hypothetical protein
MVYVGVEITRFQLQQFTVNMKELAEWFGFELARIVVDECLPRSEPYRDRLAFTSGLAI